MLLWIFRYFAFDTSITIKEHVKHKLSPSDGIPFVDLIICPNFDVAYNVTALESYGINKNEYRRKGKWTPTKNANGTDLRTVFNDVSHDVEDILIAIRIKTLTKKRQYVDIKFSKDNFDEWLTITTKYSDSFGRCYSIVPKHKVQKLGIYSIIFETRMDIYLYFGHQGQFLASGSKKKVKTIFSYL